jgi:hypothetical protein
VRAAGSSGGAGATPFGSLMMPVTLPSGSTFQPIRFCTPSTETRPRYAPAGGVASAAEYGHCLPFAAASPNTAP